MRQSVTRVFRAGGTQAGVGLVEMMVALALGLLVIGVIGTVYLGSRQSYRVEEALSRIQENARFALEVMGRDIRMAGYMGCSSRMLTPKNTLNSPTAFNYNFAEPLVGYESTGVGTWSPAVDAGITNKLSGNDILTLRSAIETNARIDAPFMNTSSADIHVTADSDLKVDEIVMVSDCAAAAIFQITNFNVSGAGNNVVHNTGGTSPGNATKDLGKTFKNDAAIVRPSTVTYYLRNNAAVAPALYRKSGTADAEELIENVEGMQILYGIDTDGDLTANRYVAANAVANMAEVMTVRVSLLLRSDDASLADALVPYTFNGTTVTPTDRRLRRVFTATFGLRNRML